MILGQLLGFYSQVSGDFQWSFMIQLIITIH